ncbi:hypothetical protein D7X88_11365 [bacterium C-53]|nr:hypothetical protein [Lachnospiraceae bacterium]NBI03635.1 hypothetical protein [Lachnospiraceae bacterium]RKJ09397.1 hypothetical protein D7X88_11365 [bacterium C-53]
MSKVARAVSVIGGADGPTSVFLIGPGKEKNIFKRMKMEYGNWKYRRRRQAVEKTIKPGMHTVGDTILYIKKQYGAVEAGKADRTCHDHDYNERKLDFKYSLIQRSRPELLGEEKRFESPRDFKDQQAVQEWMHQIDEWREKCLKRVAEIPNDVFPTDYHMLVIERGAQGSLQVETDTVHSIIQVSYSGDKKIMEPIQKDIYLFYGVSKEDIDQKTDRYRSLVTVLCG